MRFLLDVNMPPALGEALIQLGHRARHAITEGFPKAKDIDLLQFARKENEVIITHDLDFGQLLAFTGYQFPSAVIFRIHLVNAARFETLLIQHWDLINEPLESGAIVIIEDEKIRIKRLPI